MDSLISSVVGFKQAELASKIQFAVARKILDNGRQQGNAAVQLIQAATQGVAKAGDELVSAATGLGGAVDAYA